MLYRLDMTAEPAPLRDRILDTAEALILERGFNATTVDEILTGAEASKGAFFHHFPSKNALGDALLSRYYDADIATLERFMGLAEAESDDPAQQAVAFIRHFEEAADDMTAATPGCLYVSFVYERLPEDGRDDVVKRSVETWRARLLEKLELAAQTRPSLAGVDLAAVADLPSAVFEGGFILVRATGDASILRRQLSQLRRYLELLLDV